MSEKKNEITVYEKGENKVLVCRDHYNGVAVQVLRRTLQHIRKTPDSELEQIEKWQPIKTWEVKTIFVDGKKNQTRVKDEDFKGHVAEAVKKAKAMCDEIALSDETIEGTINDYASQAEAKA